MATKCYQFIQKNHLKKSNPPRNATLIEEMLLIVGTDVLLDEVEQLIEAYVAKFKEKYNTEVLYWANHDHEGHKGEDDEDKINRHVHIFFSNIGNDGKSVRRQWGRSELSVMQTDVYEVGKSIGLKIERAKKYEGQAPKGQGHRQFRQSKQKEAQANQVKKTKDLYEEKKKLRELLKTKEAKEEKDKEKIKKQKLEIEKLIEVEIPVAIDVSKEVEVENPINAGLQAYLDEAVEKLKKKDAQIVAYAKTIKRKRGKNR